MLNLLLEKCPTGMSVTGVDCHGFTPLHLAVRRGHTGVVELLLHLPSLDANVGATVNGCNPSGLKPYDYIDLMLCRPNLFLKAPKEVPTADNLTPLHFAAVDGHTEISIQNGHSGVVKLLLEKLENVGEPFMFCEEWLAPLDHSIQKGHLEVVKLLVEEAKPFQLDNHKQQMRMFENLLTVAARENYFQIIRYVLKWHPEVDANASIVLVAYQDLVASPLHFGALGGHVEAVKELLLHPTWMATEEYTDSRTPIQIATEANMKEIEKVLLKPREVKDFLDRSYRDRQVFVDAANALLVGAALIASVTFAGWLQPPLGYIPDYEFSQPFPAPPQTPESYAAVKNHATVKAFWVFNSLSFFFAISTVLAKRALIRATILLVISVVCVLGAFASAGFAVLPPLLKYDTSMIIAVCLGGTICMLTLAKIIWKLSTPICM
ncbi:hypothetical protein BDL97_06G129000 [Sphagnum fallax]|nr:hypothetical protein BDL97_06G129000 [Sphagnum fallax]